MSQGSRTRKALTDLHRPAEQPSEDSSSSADSDDEDDSDDAPGPDADAGPPHQALLPLSDAMDYEWPDLASLCVAYGIEVTTGWEILPRREDVPSKKLGTIHHAWGTSLKCTCGHHSKCTLFLTINGRWDFIEMLLVKWACAGWGASRDAHVALSLELRERNKKRKARTDKS